MFGGTSLEQKEPKSLDQGISVLQREKLPNFLSAAKTTAAMAKTGLEPERSTVRQMANYGVYQTYQGGGNLWMICASCDVQKPKPAEWLEAHKTFLDRYAGEWLLITADGILAHSNVYRDIRASVQQNRPGDYITYYVPRVDEVSFLP